LPRRVILRERVGGKREKKRKDEVLTRNVTVDMIQKKKKLYVCESTVSRRKERGITTHGQGS
jgi:hypothetical protein